MNCPRQHAPSIAKHIRLTFITEGNKSLWIKYVSSVVWYAPEVTAKATSTAFTRISTITATTVVSASLPQGAVSRVPKH